jgi:hypothetical protein
VKVLNNGGGVGVLLAVNGLVEHAKEQLAASQKAHVGVLGCHQGIHQFVLLIEGEVKEKGKGKGERLV